MEPFCLLSLEYKIYSSVYNKKKFVDLLFILWINSNKRKYELLYLQKHSTNARSVCLLCNFFLLLYLNHRFSDRIFFFFWLFLILSFGIWVRKFDPSRKIQLLSGYCFGWIFFPAAVVMVVVATRLRYSKPLLFHNTMQKPIKFASNTWKTNSSFFLSKFSPIWLFFAFTLSIRFDFQSLS